MLEMILTATGFVLTVMFLRLLFHMQHTLDRMERAAATVARDLALTEADRNLAMTQRFAVSAALARMEAGAGLVADNLADSVARADATEGPDGAAADAALRTGDTPEEIHARQAEKAAG